MKTGQLFCGLPFVLTNGLFSFIQATAAFFIELCSPAPLSGSWFLSFYIIFLTITKICISLWYIDTYFVLCSVEKKSIAKASKRDVFFCKNVQLCSGWIDDLVEPGDFFHWRSTWQHKEQHKALTTSDWLEYAAAESRCWTSATSSESAVWTGSSRRAGLCWWSSPGLGDMTVHIVGMIEKCLSYYFSPTFSIVYLVDYIISPVLTQKYLTKPAYKTGPREVSNVVYVALVLPLLHKFHLCCICSEYVVNDLLTLKWT